MDPDDFTGGFAAWSGTSFAAPVLAGELAGVLLESRIAQDSRDRVSAAWNAVNHVTGLPVPDLVSP